MGMALRLILIGAVCLGLVMPALAGEQGGKKGGVKDLKAMSKDEKIALALSAAPAHISKDAGVMLPDETGKPVEAKKGSNGFTCIPTVTNLPVPDPMCFDAAVGQWVDALVNKKEKPGNTVPGIAYMARGGYHWEKDGKILMEEAPGAKLVKEPPHWMLMWPYSSKETGLPSLPNRSGVYIMFDGTPFAHLMVEQDPNKMK